MQNSANNAKNAQQTVTATSTTATTSTPASGNALPSGTPTEVVETPLETASVPKQKKTGKEFNAYDYGNPSDIVKHTLVDYESDEDEILQSQEFRDFVSKFRAKRRKGNDQMSRPIDENEPNERRNRLGLGANPNSHSTWERNRVLTSSERYILDRPESRDNLFRRSRSRSQDGRRDRERSYDYDYRYRRRESDIDQAKRVALLDVRDWARYKAIKCTPKELTKSTEFRLWYGKLNRYMQNFSFADAFKFEDPVKITNPDVANFVRDMLDYWLDEDHQKIIEGLNDPSDCMLRLKYYREPQDRLTDVLLGKIGNLSFDPRSKTLDEWLIEFETLSRELKHTNSGWTTKQQVDCFLRHMSIPFPMIKLASENLRKKDGNGNVILEVTFEQCRKLALEENALLTERNKRMRGGTARKAYANQGNGRSFNNRNRDKDAQRGACFECHSTDHYIHDCPLATKRRTRDRDDDDGSSKRSKKSKRYRPRREKRNERKRSSKKKKKNSDRRKRNDRKARRAKDSGSDSGSESDSRSESSSSSSSSSSRTSESRSSSGGKTQAAPHAAFKASGMS